MRQKLIVLLTAVVLLLAGAGSISAHHGTAAYNTKTQETIKGTMTDFQFFNPHVRLYFDVKAQNGETEKWQAELTAPNKLARAGWTKHTLNPGDTITVTGYVARNGEHTMWIQKLVGPDGTSLPLSEN